MSKKKRKNEEVEEKDLEEVLEEVEQIEAEEEVEDFIEQDVEDMFEVESKTIDNVPENFMVTEEDFEDDDWDDRELDEDEDFEEELPMDEDEVIEEDPREDFNAYGDAYVEALVDIIETIAELEEDIELEEELPLIEEDESEVLEDDGIDEVVNESIPKEDSLRELREKASKYLRVPLAGWSKNECNQLLEKNIIPKKTTNGFWVNDEYRPVNASEWPLEMLYDFIRDELILSKEVDVEGVWDEIYSRHRLEPYITKDDVINFLLKGVEIPRTDDGIYLNDTHREKKKLVDWSFFELSALALGKIKSKYSTKEAIRALYEYIGLVKNHPENMLIETLEKGLGYKMSDLLVKSKLEEYIKLRKENDNRNPKSVGEAHANLYRFIKRLMDKDFSEFKTNFNLLLDIFNSQRNGVFGDKKRFLHWEYVPLKSDDLRGLETLFSFLMEASRPERRYSIDSSFITSQAKWFVVKESQLEKFVRLFD